MCSFIKDKGTFLVSSVYKDELEDIMTDSDKLFPFTLSVVDFLPAMSPGFQSFYNQITIDDIAQRVLATPYGSSHSSSGRPFDLLRIPQNYYYNDSRVTAIDFDKIDVLYPMIVQHHNIPNEYSTMKRVNTTSKKNRNDILLPETIERIKEEYAEDVEFYNELKAAQADNKIW
jgi:hypothetical protein